MNDDPAAKGQALRERLFGRLPANGSVDPRSRQHATLPTRVQRQTNDHLFGEVWQNQALSIEEHSLVTCAALVATGRSEQMRAHFYGARNLGIPREKIEALAEHVMHYAGWPVGMTAFRILGEIWADQEDTGE